MLVSDAAGPALKATPRLGGRGEGGARAPRDAARGARRCNNTAFRRFDVPRRAERPEHGPDSGDPGEREAGRARARPTARGSQRAVSHPARAARAPRGNGFAAAGDPATKRLASKGPNTALSNKRQARAGRAPGVSPKRPDADHLTHARIRAVSAVLGGGRGVESGWWGRGSRE